MPRIPHTIQRNGSYHFNARYPTRLIERGVVSRTHYKRTLGTKDWREAKARVARVLLEFQYEIERLDRESAKAKRPVSTRPLSALSSEERRDIIFS